MKHNNLETLNDYSDTCSAVAGLTERLSSGIDQPSQSLQTLPLEEIGAIPELFQSRDMRHDQLQSTYHIESLVKAIDANETHTLDPVTIWWTGDSWVVIDGHHRLDAYRAYQETLKKPKVHTGHHRHMSDKSVNIPAAHVPVSVFKGTVLEATLYSTATNSQDKLPMSKDSKLTRAWQLVTIEWKGLTLKSIARCCAIHNRSVSNMRLLWNKAQKTHSTEELDELRSLSWKQARHWNKDAQETPWGNAEREAEINRIRDTLVKSFGKTLHAKPSLFAEALERYSPAFASDVFLHLTPQMVPNGGDILRHEDGENEEWEWTEDEDGELDSDF
jgi:hypothetical protein